MDKLQPINPNTVQAREMTNERTPLELVKGPWKSEPFKAESKPGAADGDKFTWIYRVIADGSKEYLAGTAGRMTLDIATEILPLLNAAALIEREAPVEPSNQEVSLRTGARLGECLCGWLVRSNEKFCGACGKALLWK